ncbi:MAG: hypothetical protein QOG69_1032 [Actinomycetota bacterium]|jgi:hypothetical protein|nr:hypothetical protein [Actinomycetota bacterium]
MDQSQGGPVGAGPEVFLLTVRGTPNTESVGAARDLHNATAGLPQSVAGARALGDLSHNVFLPTDRSDLRLLFIDTWNNPAGVGQFFSNPQVAEAAGALFKERDATLWTQAVGFGSYSLPAPSGRSVAGVGYLRANVTSLEAARSAFHADAAAHINQGRLAGQVGHHVWVPAPVPGAETAVEVLGIDYWLDVDQMVAFYTDTYMSQLGPVFTAAPDTGTWKSAGSDWVEW